MTLRPGTPVSITGHDFGGNVTREAAQIMRWHPISGEQMPGWHRVRFDADRAILVIHESRIEPTA